MSQLFINPLFLWFAGLISLPIIIYLINRHRYRRRKWAAMEFLLRALRKNQRRLQVQNLLLLLIRILIILLLVLALARPVLRQNPLGMTVGERQNWVLAVDVSYSMEYRDGPRSLFDEARESMTQMIEAILQDGDSVTLAILAREPRILVPRSTVNPDLRQVLLREIEDLETESRSLRIVPCLSLLEELVGEFVGPTGEPEGCRIVLFSDLQRKDWLEGDRPRSPEIREIVERIEARGGQFSVARLSRDRKLNVAVTDVSMKPELVAREVPVLLSVTLSNLSDEVADNLDLTVRIQAGRDRDDESGGEAQLGEVLRIPGRGTVTRPLPYRFDEPGYYTVTAEVRSDGLVVDNRRFLVVPVQEDVEVLIVDGDPAANPVDRETFYLELALQPKDDDLGVLGARFTPFLPEYITDDQLGDVEDFTRYSVVVLANVAEVPIPALGKLKSFVADGGALLVFLGDNVRTEFYNEHLYEQDGEGLLPLRLGDRRGDRSAPVHLQFIAPTHPVVRYFEEHKKGSYLKSGIVSFFYYIQVSSPEPASAVRVLARYNDLDGSPAIFDAPFGRGRVMWVTTTADKEWTDLPVWQDFVVLVYESISYLMGFSARSLNLRVGDPFLRFYASEDFAPEVLLTVPARDRQDLVGSRVVRRAMLPDGKRMKLSYDDTRAPGLYRLDLKRPNTARGDSVEYFAVNVDTGESDLKRITAAEFREHFGVEPVPFDASERFRDIAKQKDLLRGREYWRWLLGALLVLLLGETVLAQFFGRRAK
ncbi:MAG: BatA domain-containing protein [Planctomycetota bacterium]|nr:BatA domain-containing protein [Planctomycetota bacterium]